MNSTGQTLWNAVKASRSQLRAGSAGRKGKSAGERDGRADPNRLKDGPAENGKSERDNADEERRLRALHGETLCWDNPRPMLVARERGEDY